MPNKKSSKKALRGSLNKKGHNLFWKKRIHSARKGLSDLLSSKQADVSVLNESLTAFQKVLDKASKEKVIHKNKANRLKSRYAKKIAARKDKPISAKSKPKKAATKKQTTKKPKAKGKAATAKSS